MENKNILEFCLSPALGGLELCVKDNYEYFKEKTTTYICVAPNKSLDKILDIDDKFLLTRNKFFPIFPALKLAKFINEKDIDVIHFHWTRDIAVVVLAKVLSTKKPKIVQSRHMRMTRFKDDFYHKWLYKNIDIMHAVTKEVAKQLKKYILQDIRPKVEMVYLGVNEPNIDKNKVKNLKEKYALNDKFTIGIVGRIEDGKGQHLVIEAIGKLKELNIKALIVGSAMDDEYLASLKEKGKKLDIEDKVIFTGFTKDVNEHMQLCDAIVLATIEETFGLVVIEAMVNKKCIIAVNKGGPLEIIEDSKDGLLFDRDSDELKNKIKSIYEDANLKNKLSLNGFEKVKKIFNKELQNHKLYDRIIKC